MASTVATVFLKVQSVEGKQPPRQSQRFDEPLGGLNLVVFVGILNQHLSQHDALPDGEGAQHLGGPGVLEAVQAAPQRFAVQGDDGAVPGQSRRVVLEVRGDLRAVQPPQGIADRAICRGAPPAAAERLIQPGLVGAHELMDAPVRGRPAHHRQDAEQQQMRQVIELPLGAAWVRDWQQALFQWGHRKGQANPGFLLQFASVEQP